MKIVKYPSKETWPELLKRPAIDNALREANVSKIISDVKKNGDTAVKKYCLEFDKCPLTSLKVTEEEFISAEKKCSQELKTAIRTAAANIRKFHEAQKEEVQIIETTPGVKCWRKSIGIEKVGLYIPGGSAPLFSTVLMLGIPAVIAGCKKIIICTPCDKNGKINAAVLYAARFAGITEVYKIGGVQAIAAMAYGTESISNVYKIFGPGNQYVTCAKQLVSKDGVAIDMPAGPSEVAVLADETCVPAFVAADLLSQAEHGGDSQVLLVTTSDEVIDQVIKEVQLQSQQLERKNSVTAALENSKCILVKSEEEGVELLNEYAPEHLIIVYKNEDLIAEKIVNAGSVFLGNYSPESAGDYASGTNHTLPTNGYARSYSGISLDSFVKKITFQKISEAGLKALGNTIETMAEAEGLGAHKNAVTIRIKKQSDVQH